MGLDTSHECWHGAYSSFARWRNWIAVQLDWDFETDAEGRDKNYIIPEERIPVKPKPMPLPVFCSLMDIHENGNPFFGDWFEDPADVIDVLMIHSDCDGRIPARFCLPLAQRLTLLIQDADPDADWRTTTVQFIEGLIRAHNRSEDVDFH